MKYRPFERAFITVIDDISDNNAAMAVAAWPEMPSAPRRLQAMIQREKKNDPQQVLLEDAYRLSLALDVPLNVLIKNALDLLGQQKVEVALRGKVQDV